MKVTPASAKMRCLSSVLFLPLLVQTVSSSSANYTTIKQTVSGSVKFTVASHALCEALKVHANTKLINKFEAAIGKFRFNESSIDKITLSCARRLSDETRRLLSTATMAYMITVPVASTTSGDQIKTLINGLTPASWASVVNSAATDVGISGWISVSASSFILTAATTTTITTSANSDSSFAGKIKLWSLPVTLLLMAWNQFS